MYVIWGMNRYFLTVVADELTRFSAKQNCRHNRVKVSPTVDFVFASAGFGTDPAWATKFWNSCVSRFSSFSFTLGLPPPLPKSLRGHVGRGPAPIKVSGSAATAFPVGLSPLPLYYISNCNWRQLIPIFSSPSAHNGRSIFQTEKKVPLNVPKSSRDTGKILIIKYIWHTRSQLFSNNFFFF